MSLKDRLNNTGNKTTKQLNNKPEIITRKAISSENSAPNGINILEAMLVDENINSVHIDGAKNVYIERNGRFLKSAVSFRDNVQLADLIIKLAEESGIEEDNISSYMKFTIRSGISLKVTLPPVTNIPSVFIKCYYDKLADTKIFQEKSIISKELSLIFEALSLIKYNIIVAGEENTFKTSVLSSILKLIPANNRCLVFDSHNELKTNSSILYNLSSLDEKERNEIVKTAISSNPDKIIINDNNEEIFPLFADAVIKGRSGVITSITASNKEEALEKIIKVFLKENTALNYNEAKKLVYDSFNMMIFCEKDKKTGARKISSISEIENDGTDCIIKDIFKLSKINDNNEEHVSTGVIPKLYELAKESAIPINPNIFINDYKHTYSKKTGDFPEKNIISSEIISKQKKDNTEYRSADTNTSTGNDLIRKAQEKFEELKRNAKFQSNLNNVAEESGAINDDNNSATIEEINNSLYNSAEPANLNENTNNG